MTLTTMALTEEHRALAAAVHAFAARHASAAHTRAAFDGPVPDRDGWRRLAAQGWLGLHVPEALGGGGYGMLELAVAGEQFGHALAPGPWVAGTAAATALAAGMGRSPGPAGDAPTAGSGARTGPPDAGTVLRGVLDGSVVAGLALGGAAPDAPAAVLGGRAADVLLVPDGADLLLVSVHDPAVRRDSVLTPDPSLDLAALRLGPGAVVGRLSGAMAPAHAALQVAVAAVCAGGAHACLAMAREHALSRHQFGRPIGSFQAIKHRLADMLAAAELAGAAAWAAGTDRSAGPAAVAAAVVSPAAYVDNARALIQVLGALGVSWDHDAQLHLRRATGLRLVTDPGRTEEALYRLIADGARFRYRLDPPTDDAAARDQVRAFRTRYLQEPEAGRRELLVRSGYLVPHWPPPYGRGAGPLEQLVVEEELADVPRPALGVGGWVLLTLLQAGDPDQVERWVLPTLLGELRWCQLFSEPEAGSDAASVRTRAVRAEGGWSVTGHKTWITAGQSSDLGLATVRVAGAPAGRDGVTAMVLNLRGPGVTTRPLRDLTGRHRFAEVLLDGVFVPDGDVVGPVGQGWRVARAAFGNERVTIGGGWATSLTAEDLTTLAARRSGPDGDERRRIARLLAEGHAVRALELRRAARAVAGATRGAEGDVTKVLAAEHAQRVGELALELAGPGLLVGEHRDVLAEHLFTRTLTIGGGTSEISRNLIAERRLGMPREPRPG